jgi:hypothetical protein
MKPEHEIQRFGQAVSAGRLCKRLSTLALVAVIATAALGITPAVIYNASGEPKLIRSGWLLPLLFAALASGLWLMERLLIKLALRIFQDSLNVTEQKEADSKGLFPLPSPIATKQKTSSLT